MNQPTPHIADKFDVHVLRGRFPVLQRQVNGKNLVYFDNAATTQKPEVVIEALAGYYRQYNANIHRGLHALAEKATAAYEDTRRTIRQFIHAPEADEIIFTSGTTASINLVATAYGRKFLGAGDEVIISALEHHSNIVPWQLLCEEKNATLKVIPVDEKGNLVLADLAHLIGSKTKIVAVNHVSNSLGTINPVAEIIRMAHNAGAVVLLDGAQATAHIDVDVQALDCDFYAFSAHKLFGPTGVGVLYGKRSLLEAMNPYQGGGEMIKEVTFEKTTYAEIPYKFEAGTPNIADVIAFKAAIDFVEGLGDKSELLRYEQSLLQAATKQLKEIRGLKIIGEADEKIGVVSFVMEGMHHFDIGMMLDAKGIAVRTGHHCTQPLMHQFGIEGTIRASFSIYNTIEEVNFFVESLKQIVEKWR
ncbi:MAG: cysteine desulfurase [Cyclobacteriaceae bacterium]|nr:cysteine desulfurase [Cyclobacteriaceae bacterium]